MAGQLKVGGNIIASHSGVEGAGTVTLQNTTLDSGVTFPKGHILQVQYTQFTSTAVMTDIEDLLDYVLCDGTAGSGTEILNVNIKPISESSKIWIQVQWMGQLSDAQAHNIMFFLYRDS